MQIHLHILYFGNGRMFKRCCLVAAFDRWNRDRERLGSIAELEDFMSCHISALEGHSSR